MIPIDDVLITWKKPKSGCLKIDYLYPSNVYFYVGNMMIHQ